MNRAEFAAWLAARPPRLPVGTAMECPLRVYLREAGHRYAYVGAAEFSLGLYDNPHPMKGEDAWMEAFTRWADDEAMGGQGWLDITAAAASEALAAIPRIEGDAEGEAS